MSGQELFEEPIDFLSFFLFSLSLVALLSLLRVALPRLWHAAHGFRLRYADRETKRLWSPLIEAMLESGTLGWLTVKTDRRFVASCGTAFICEGKLFTAAHVLGRAAVRERCSTSFQPFSPPGRSRKRRHDVLRLQRQAWEQVGIRDIATAPCHRDSPLRLARSEEFFAALSHRSPLLLLWYRQEQKTLLVSTGFIGASPSGFGIEGNALWFTQSRPESCGPGASGSPIVALLPSGEYRLIGIHVRGADNEGVAEILYGTS